ncbi:unnamed protein product [Paramecium primaurelia]|uniref:Uncharacterized protein n=1 Tax=Paramecium primaurelia TaxID=5886 RepID=A0A8S1QKM5_PARPR|nr:unnamed protein product [Paramecium primaurelia]
MLIYQSFQPLYFAIHTRLCKICPINYCLFCFEYNYYGYEKNSALTTYDLDIVGEDFQLIKIVFLQFQDGYKFNFNSGLCVNQIPRIQYCLTSYLKQLEETCLISTLNNFKVSRTINNFDDQILNCQIYTLYYQQVIICIK